MSTDRHTLLKVLLPNTDVVVTEERKEMQRGLDEREESEGEVG
jgi:hypothetical protein